jgi:hypothetical protein
VIVCWTVVVVCAVVVVFSVVVVGTVVVVVVVTVVFVGVCAIPFAGASKPARRAPAAKSAAKAETLTQRGGFVSTLTLCPSAEAA